MSVIRLATKFAVQEGFGYFQATQRNGRRWSTARAFLDPARRRPNLRIETDALAPVSSSTASAPSASPICNNVSKTRIELWRPAMVLAASSGKRVGGGPRLRN